MTIPTRWLVFAICALCTRADERRALAESPAATPRQTRVALAQKLPPLDGQRLQATIAEISYAPGASSPAHTHPCPVMVYVVEGAIRTRLKGEPEKTYRAGETFFEAANGVHEHSANASREAPAKFLAIFVCDRDGPLATPLPAATGAR